MRRVRFGIVGLGIGRAQARAIARDPRGEIVALCDLDPARMEACAAELPGPVRRYTEYAALCADPEVDAVFVGTPNALHAPVALAAIRAGKHVLCTKPLADSEAAAEEVVRAAEASGRVHMMSLSTRFGGAVQYLGRLARRGELGEIYYARAQSVRRSGIPHWGAHFVERGGGALRDMGVHALDAAWWLAGCPEPVAAMGVAGARFGPRGEGFWEFGRPEPSLAERFAADDYGAGLIRFAGGAAIQIESFWACHQPERFQIELFGTEAGARLDPPALFRTLEGRPVDLALSPPPTDGLEGVARHFIACILDGIPCEAPLRHGLVIQRILEAVLASAESGREVRLDGASSAARGASDARERPGM